MKERLYAIALESLADADKQTLFSMNKKDAMVFLNKSRANDKGRTKS